MVLVGESFPDAKARVAAEVTCEPRMLLKTIRAISPRLLPRRWPAPARHRQLWNVASAQGPPRTVLDVVPTPTNLMVATTPKPLLSVVHSAEFKKSFTTFHSLSPERSMLLWPTPGRLTSWAWPPMALVSSFAIQGRVSASSDPLMIRVGQLTLLALERASNGPMANEVLPMRARSIAQASRLVIGLSSICALTSRRRTTSIATVLPRDQSISVTWSRGIDACRCRYVIAASAER